jgi:sugar lactone lactonase YvrE
MMSNMATALGDVRCELGENPLWHSGEGCLYWTDIPAGSVYRCDPNVGIAEKVYEGGVVGGFTIQADGTLLLFMEAGRIAKLKQGKIDILIEEIPDERTSRFNDVIADPKGRVFCGTMPTNARPGRLYRLDPDGKLNVLVEGIGCSNGLAFSPDCQYLYYTDSHAYAIYRFRYSELTGEIANQETFIRCLQEDGYPDGLTRDSEGYLWSARWGGGCIIRYSPEGLEEQRIALPAKLVTSLTFGGRNLSDMYVTTAKDTEAPGPEPHGGAVFRLSPGFRGVAEFPSRIEI